MHSTVSNGDFYKGHRRKEGGERKGEKGETKTERDVQTVMHTRKQSDIKGGKKVGGIS